jgi:2-keto-4-pentenoate hydratase
VNTTSTGVDEAVRRLTRAASELVPCRPVRDLLAATDISAAYQVQRALIAARTTAGARRVGRKIGLTSPAVQRQLGVGQPDFGVLLDDMVVPPGGVVPAGRLLQPKVEGEVAFVLRTALDGELSYDSVRAAVATAHAAIEIVDSRISGWDITIVDTVADNASSGMFVMSASGLPLAEVEPRQVQMSLRRGGEVASTGDGSACLGDPIEALLWLARTAADYGDPLRAGEIVLSGALGPMVAVSPGDAFQLEINGLGTTEVSFAGGKT